MIAECKLRKQLSQLHYLYGQTNHTVPETDRKKDISFIYLFIYLFFWGGVGGAGSLRLVLVMGWSVYRIAQYNRLLLQRTPPGTVV